MSASRTQRTGLAASLADCNDRMGTRPSIHATTSKSQGSSGSRMKKWTKKDDKVAGNEALDGDPGTGKNRKVRFSLLNGVEEEDMPSPSAKQYGFESDESETSGEEDGGKDSETEEFENASTKKVKDWAKKYSEETIGWTGRTPWSADSDVESNIDSESESEAESGPDSKTEDVSEGEDETAKDQEGETAATLKSAIDSTGVARPNTQVPQTAASAALDGRDSTQSYITVHNPAPVAGSKRKAEDTSHEFDMLPERPKKRMRSTG